MTCTEAYKEHIEYTFHVFCKVVIRNTMLTAIRTWNRAVDRAIVSGVPEAEILELKKTEITDRVKEFVEQNGKKPELFGDIVRAAIELLECLITKVMQKVMDIAEKVIGKVTDSQKETPKEMGIHIHTKDEPVVQPERKKILFPINPQRRAKADAQNKELPQQESTSTVKKFVVGKIKTGQKSVPAEAKRQIP